jgi:lipopolysaccharide transport system ATP-binding protein
MPAKETHEDRLTPVVMASTMELAAAAETPPAADVALAVRGVSKAYRLYERPQDRLKEALFGRLGRHYGHDFWALRDVSFDVRRGEMFGIVGRNGSGKSTLLQIMAGIDRPTTGSIDVRGRVGALLELGSGFDPEATGRENVFMNGAILGVSTADITRRFDEIAAFADIGEFIDQPVKLYSSGMFVRLAFAVTTSLDPEILLIDEALAVGDVFFRQKCYGRLSALRDKGTSILLVSHAMGDIEQFCERALLLDHGRPLVIGPASEVVKHYYLLQQPASVGSARSAAAAVPDVARSTQDGAVDLTGVIQVSDGRARCTAIAVQDEAGRAQSSFEQGERAVFVYEFTLSPEASIEVPVGGLVIRNDRLVLVHGKSTLELPCDAPPAVTPGGRVRFVQSVQLGLAPGEYTVEFGFAAVPAESFRNRAILSHEELTTRVDRLCHLVAPVAIHVGLRRAGKPTQLLHHGVADLPGACTITALESAQE